MRLIYHITTGLLTGLLAADGTQLDASGYSGHPPHVNDVGAQGLHAQGPIPAGTWKLGEPADHPNLGPLAIPLEPADGTDTFGRDGFFIHGDSIEHPGFASHGCIVLPRDVRQAVASSGETFIEVVP